jgi:hypothetical protein
MGDALNSGIKYTYAKMVYVELRSAAGISGRRIPPAPG